MTAIETDPMLEAGLMIETEDIIGTIRLSEVGATLETIGLMVAIIGVIEETFEIEMKHMAGEESRIQMIEEGLQEGEVKVDLEIETGLEIEVRGEDVIIAEINLNKENKNTEGSWLDFCWGIMQEET